jgi:predicted transcriptional regulator
VSAANYMLQTLMMLGLVYKSKEGRKTYYTFASTSEHDLDLACCGVLEHLNYGMTEIVNHIFLGYSTPK